MPNIQQLAAGVRSGHIRPLAKAITLIESRNPDHSATASNLLDTLMPSAGNSIRIGISGVPGAGKSTFIEALGLHLVEQGHKLAILAVDPTSQLSGGSILGDKTRMEMLAREQKASFVRHPRETRLAELPARLVKPCCSAKLPATMSSSSRPSALASPK